MKKIVFLLVVFSVLASCAPVPPVCSDTLVIEEMRGNVKMSRVRCQEWKEQSR